MVWITPTIRRQIRKRNKLYQQYKTSRSDEIHHKFLILKYSIQKQIRLTYWLYVTGFAKTVPNGTRIEIQIIA